MEAYPLGAVPTATGGRFRIWAPEQPSLAIVIDGRSFPLRRDRSGYHTGEFSELRADARYQLRLPNGEQVADPCSRFQPEGPHGPSQVVDAKKFRWMDAAWKGRPLEEYVIYEMHIGTFTPEGTWASATRELQELAAAGITCVEVMPVAEFPGNWGWGYDGVLMFAPYHHYGLPDDFRAFVNTAHQEGLCVLLDVVYNHFGPDGNHLRKLASAYFSTRHKTDWGEAINFDGPDNGPVREFILSNVSYWIEDFHVDGLRLDATQDIHDDAPPDRHILTAISRTARTAAPDRTIVIVAENEPQEARLCRNFDQGGFGFDGLWNDDFHHSAAVALTGRREAYYTDYYGNPQEFVSVAKHGFLYQGQWYSWQEKPRGQPAFDLKPSAFITFIQDHDQIANSCRGERAHKVGSPGRYRALSALMMLGPGTPMLFQGQEFAASSPFFYFADHKSDLGELVAAGRREFLSQFPSMNDPEALDLIASPGNEETFLRCKLKLEERTSHAEQYQLTRDLLALRHSDPCFRAAHRRAIDGAVIGDQAFVLRYFMNDGCDRLLSVNLGRDLHLTTIPEPLLSCGSGFEWVNRLSTESPAYGGSGVVRTDENGWHLHGESAVFMTMCPVASEGQRGSEL